VGVLGGSVGTTHDAFELPHSAKRYGARVALFGRKINAAEHQLSFVVTVGSNGCYYTSGTNSSIIHFPAFKVETSDTNGCGDTFHGAFALAVAHNFSLDHAITFASAAAARHKLPNRRQTGS
jgi:sugar/nucleoside kinase (ribokinase family)